MTTTPRRQLRAILVGSGGTSRALLQRLGEAWDVAVIDPSEEALARAAVARPGVRCIVGDGSSPVVLRRAGLEGADALLAASDDDEVNVAACMHARRAGVARIVAAVEDPERIPEYASAGIDYHAGDQLVAARISQALEPRGIVASDFAGGRATAIEFHLAGDSPVRGHALRELHSERWVAGAVLRGDRLIIPSGDTVFEAGDIVTVVGPAGAFSEIVRTFTAGEARFPLEYGTTVAVVEPRHEVSPTLLEAAYLARISRADRLIVLAGASGAGHARAEQITEAAGGVEVSVRESTTADDSTLRALLERESVGVLVVPAPGDGLLGRLDFARRARLARRHDVAVLLSRGRHPYRRIVVPARHTMAARVAARTGIDIARAADAELQGVGVTEPSFVRGGTTLRDVEEAVAWLKDEAAVQGVAVTAELETGNPARRLRAAAADADLVVLGMEPGASMLRMSVASHVARGVSASVLLVPVTG